MYTYILIYTYTIKYHVKTKGDRQYNLFIIYYGLHKKWACLSMQQHTVISFFRTNVCESRINIHDTHEYSPSISHISMYTFAFSFCLILLVYNYLSLFQIGWLTISYYFSASMLYDWSIITVFSSLQSYSIVRRLVFIL